jgi:hypothetical protein
VRAERQIENDHFLRLSDGLTADLGLSFLQSVFLSRVLTSIAWSSRNDEETERKGNARGRKGERWGGVDVFSFSFVFYVAVQIESNLQSEVRVRQLQ